MQIDLSRLLARCLAGDELAWETLVRSYQSRVYGIAYHYLGDPEEARDLAQEIFVRVYQRLATCSDPNRFLPWLIRVARNASLDRLRHFRTRPPRTDIPVEEASHLTTSEPGPDELWARDRRKQLIQEALRSMSALNREVIILKEMQGMTLEEMAEVLEVPVGTVKSRSNRARIELARRVMALTGGEAPQGIN